MSEDSVTIPRAAYEHLVANQERYRLARSLPDAEMADVIHGRLPGADYEYTLDARVKARMRLRAGLG